MAIEMRRKGIGDEAIEQALQGITQEQEASLALQAARRLVRRLEGLEWNDYRNRLSSHLARRGFDYGTIRAIVEQTWKELSITNEK
jgi:regulatory protein